MFLAYLNKNNINKIILLFKIVLNCLRGATNEWQSN